MPERFNVSLSGLGEALWQLEEDINACIRPAAQAGAQVLYDAVKSNVARIKKDTGRLDDSIYQVYSKIKSTPTNAVYEVSYNPSKAPHGHLVEYGHIQRYVIVKYDNGNLGPMVRPEMRGKPAPKKSASQSEKDAYYVLRKTPVQVAAQPFMRPAMTKFNEAMDAVKDRLLEELAKR